MRLPRCARNDAWCVLARSLPLPVIARLTKSAEAIPSLLSLRGAPIHQGDEAISEGLLGKEIAALRIRSARNDKK